MHALKSDIKINELWERCRLKRITLLATWSTTGAIYINTYNNMKSVACEATPIVLSDESSAYWTISRNEFYKNFMTEGGSRITNKHIDDMFNGEILRVRQRHKAKLWAFHVEVVKYRWDCPYGANQSGYLHGTGDYLVCNGSKAPDLTTLRLVNYEMFKRFYERRERMSNVLSYEDGKYTCAGKTYDTFREGLVAMMEAVTWRGEEYDFQDIDANLLSPLEQKQYLLLTILHGRDLTTVFNSRSYTGYRRFCKVAIPQDEILMNPNPFAVDNLKMPMTYEVNKNLHTALLPELGELYVGISDKWFKIGNQVYKLNKLLSYALDTTLFEVDTTPFVRAMRILVSLTKHKSTAALVDYVTNPLLPKAEILAMQIEAGDYIDQEEILLQGDLRHTRYHSKTEEAWGGNDYVDIMLSLPPSMQDKDDYYAWLKSAADIMGKELDIIPKKEEEVVISPMPEMAETVEPEEIELEDGIAGAWAPEPVETYPEPVEVSQEPEEPTVEEKEEVCVLQEAARTFCYELNIPEKDIDEVLPMFDWESQESARSFPTFIREKFGVMEVTPMVNYLYAIHDRFGSIGG